MTMTANKFPRIGGFVLVGVLLIAGLATPIRSAEEVDEGATAHDTAITPATAPWRESADHVADEILRLRQSIGGLWRGDAIADFDSSADATEREVIRTALAARAGATVEEPSVSRRQSDFSQQAALREAAHQLDLTAHALECQELYPQADEVRAVAQRLRQQAREAPIPTLRFNGKRFTPVCGNAAD